MKNSINELLSDVKRRYDSRLEQFKKALRDKGFSEKAVNFKTIAEDEVQSEIIHEVGSKNVSNILVPNNIYNYSVNIDFLKALIRISPAYICIASKDVLKDENFLKEIAKTSPMSVVHLYGNDKIDIFSFLKLVKCNPIVLQNFSAYSDYGLANDEMIDAALYQVDAEEKKSYKQLRLGYDVASYCMLYDGVGEFTNKRIKYLAQFALPDSLYDVIKTDDATERITELLKIFPQAIKSMDEFDVKCDGGDVSKYYDYIQEAIDANPNVEKFYHMDNDEFNIYMDGYITEQRKLRGLDLDEEAERKAIIKRIATKKDLLNTIQGKTKKKDIEGEITQ